MFKIAADHVSDGTKVADGFKRLLANVVLQLRPNFIIETGTHLGTGSTAAICEAMEKGGLGHSYFVTCECNPAYYQQALRNLEHYVKAMVCLPCQAISVPRHLLPDAQALEEAFVKANPGPDVFVDHQPQDRVRLYQGETDFPEISDDFLGLILAKHQPDMVILDSGGHMGNIEFNYAISKITKPCIICLDDVHHVKHANSFEQAQADSRFKVLYHLDEKFGSAVLRFDP